MIPQEPYRVLDSLLRDIRAGGATGAATLHRQPRPEFDIANRVALGPLPTRGEALGTVLRNRTSTRNYSDEPIPLNTIAAVLAAAVRSDERNWPNEQTRVGAVELVLVAWRVDGLPAATYIYAPQSHEALAIGPAPCGSDAEELVIQREFARAAALVIVLGGLAEAVSRYGGHGHRQLLVRAGAAAHAATLAALSLGLGACVTGGLLPRAVENLAGIDGYRQSVLFAVALGGLTI